MNIIDIFYIIMHLWIYTQAVFLEHVHGTQMIEWTYVVKEMAW